MNITEYRLTHRDLKAIRGLCAMVGYGRGYPKEVATRCPLEPFDGSQLSLNDHLFEEADVNHDLADLRRLSELPGQYLEIGPSNKVSLDVWIYEPGLDGECIDYLYPHGTYDPETGRMNWTHVVTDDEFVAAKLKKEEFA